MSKIKAVLSPKKSTKKPPVIQQNTRGRPTTKQVQQRLHEASRIDEELRRSSFGDANTSFEGSRQSLGMDQSSWGLIRRDLVQEMDQNESIWFPIFEAWDEGYFYTHRQSLIWNSVSSCGEDHWMDFPLAGLLIAQTYSIGVHLLKTTMGASSTFFPIPSPPANQQPLFITVTHVNENHFIHVKLEGDYPMPPAHGLWLNHRRPHTEQWEDMYLARLEWYTSIMNPPPRSNPSLNYIDSDTEE
ncbi:uncharacterized protein LOC110883178 [Helianthus annuus]|uniref:uncharacterized protein LOC110883178 n=1 Tax=Helianthus annuus TaxID=4232 RepID=UPI000B8F5164|nr:uncharacterized protein LOC110883178 [Helianthus annuus]